MYAIEFFRTSTGRVPVEKFLNSVNRKVDLPFIMNALAQLEEHGPRLQGKFVKYLQDGIYELRVRTVSGQFRLFYFFYDRNKIIITHGIHKKAKQKDVYPPELRRALAYRQEYLDQHS